MPRNGSGGYSLPAGNPVVTGTTISSTTTNNTNTDIENALTNSVSADGQTTMTGNLPMGGNKITGLAAGTSASDAARFDQIPNSALKVNVSDLAASSGAAMVGINPPTGGAANETVDHVLSYITISVERFGILGIGNDRAIFQAACNFCKVGKTLDLGGNVIDLGTVVPGTPAILIDSPIGMRIIGSGALIKCIGSVDRCVAIAVKNPNDFKSNGVNFTDPNFTISSTYAGSRIGIYGYSFYATSPYTALAPCGNIQVDGIATNTIGFVICDSTTQLGSFSQVAYAVKNLKVTGFCNSTYYGVSSLYGAVDVDAKLICKDVRRGFVSYGQNRAVVDLSIECSAGFLGSNAFVELGCEGVTAGNVRDIDIRVRASGVEGHEAYVNFYHQGSEATGSIGNIKARVTCDALTTVGKNGSLGPLNIYRFMHEYPPGTVLSSTARTNDNLDIDCDVLGSTSSVPVLISSVPNSKVPITIGRGLAALIPNWSLWTIFKVVSGRRSDVFTPSILGSTIAGAGTYTSRLGAISIVDGVATVSILLNWSAHTGTGNISISPLPIAAGSNAVAGYPTCSIVSSGVGPANTIIQGAITGTMDVITMYAMDITSRVANLVPITTSGLLEISVTYSLYPN